MFTVSFLLCLSHAFGVSWFEVSDRGQSVLSVHVGVSGDGSKMIASYYMWPLFTSSDGGASWTNHTSLGSHNWQAVGVSDDGSKMVAATFSKVCISSDGGASWTEASVASFQGIAVSPDGSKMAGVVTFGSATMVAQAGLKTPR